MPDRGAARRRTGSPALRPGPAPAGRPHGPRRRHLRAAPHPAPHRRRPPHRLLSTGCQAVLTPRRSEPIVLPGASQLQVAHRYFGTSRPAGPGYTHLTVRRAADDHHRVVRLFRRLYPAMSQPLVPLCQARRLVDLVLADLRT
ncbi:hypothetical protein [Streptomyces sp. AK010]|uniref:hypothetical protein n=1 Tax=Streptomyces sp. AK010 TaxID=2723074 RepID=UPI0028930A9C|nr:hypothetical protein [Streptomyces sp. AK010]